MMNPKEASFVDHFNQGPRLVHFWLTRLLRIEAQRGA